MCVDLNAFSKQVSLNNGKWEACLSNGGVKNGLSNGEWEEWCEKLGSYEPSYFLRLGW